jgi:hypothetical protein
MASRLLITTMSVLYFFFCSEATLAAGADTDRSGPFICPLKKCKSCPTRAQLTQPGFGFALEMGYGYLFPAARQATQLMCHTGPQRYDGTMVLWNPLLKLQGRLHTLVL